MSSQFPVTLAVRKTKQEQFKNNVLYVHPDLHFEDTDLALVDGRFLFVLRHDPAGPPGTAGLSLAQRESTGKTGLKCAIDVDLVDRKYIDRLSVLRLSVEMFNPTPCEIDANVLKLRIVEVYRDYPFNKGQRLYLEYFSAEGDPAILILSVTELATEGGEPYGILHEACELVLASASAKLSLTNSHGQLRSNLSFEQLGIGGLKKEFEVMFRRAFVQRFCEPGLIKSFGITHVKGIILYGPPGTGKTLIARQLGSLLNARPPKVVNGPEILNKYVGQSEENIRNLFKEAEEEFRQMRERSTLHIIIFDEIDAICKQRGSGGSAGVGDQVVNQLLSKLDGVEALDNILVIGMTNRLDMIDEALLRPGRFEIHLEISLPDAASRFEIFTIHTKKMSGNNFLDQSVDLKQLAALSKNYTGAEIAAVVRGAISFALERNAGLEEKLRMGGTEDPSGSLDAKLDLDGRADAQVPDIKVTMADMLAALDETRPAFGVDESEFTAFNKVFYETLATTSMESTSAEMLERLRRTNLYNTNSLLIYGPTGTGKTSMAVRAALRSTFPFVKLISPRHLVGLAEFEKINYIKNSFSDAYKSEEACVILDDIEGLIEFANIGPRFSNPILQALKIYIKRESTKKLFVFGTTSCPDVMQECGIFDAFDTAQMLPPVSHEDFQQLCQQNPAFGAVDYAEPLPIGKLLRLLPDADYQT
ncbi:vesicle-fusing ATPase [Pancytospora philotis]|nr:vesicle-fusing ATPase [Pancytospora philotis]KAI4292284.1 vesicle-fusing ATPase [Pancytospora philotis]